MYHGLCVSLNTTTANKTTNWKPPLIHCLPQFIPHDTYVPPRTTNVHADRTKHTHLPSTIQERPGAAGTGGYLLLLVSNSIGCYWYMLWAGPNWCQSVDDVVCSVGGRRVRLTDGRHITVSRIIMAPPILPSTTDTRDRIVELYFHTQWISNKLGIVGVGPVLLIKLIPATGSIKYSTTMHTSMFIAYFGNRATDNRRLYEWVYPVFVYRTGMLT